MSVKSRAVVLRRSDPTEEDIRRSAARVGADDRVEGLPVQLLDSNLAELGATTYALLMQPMRPGPFAVCRALAVFTAGGVIVQDPLAPTDGRPRNPYHALVSGITVAALQKALRPVA